MKRSAFLFLLMILAAAPGPGEPGRAATQPAERISIPPARPMSGDFDLLNHRSMFLKGREVPSGEAAVSALPRAATVMVFNGVAVEESQTIAFIEDTAGGTVSQMRVGDSIGSGLGKITGITLDAMEYEAGGKTIRIALGQSLTGADGQSLLYGLGPAASTQPAAGGGAANPDVAATLERMKQRRLQELGGK